MAMTLAQYEDIFQLVSGYLYWRKNGLTNRVQDSLYSYVYSRDGIVPFDKGLPTSICRVNLMALTYQMNL